MIRKALLLSFSILAAVPQVSLAQQADDGVFTTNRRTFNDLEPLSFQDIKNTIKPVLMEMPSVRGVVSTENGDNVIVIVAVRNLTINLDGLRTRLNTRGTDRQNEYDKFYKAIRKTISNGDPFTPENLKVVIRTSDALNDFEQQTALDKIPNYVLRRPLFDNLEMAVVADTKTSIAFMPIGRLHDLSLTEDDAFKKAIQNMNDNAQTIEFKDNDGLYYANVPAGFAPSLMLLDNVIEMLKTKYPDGYAVAIPNRDEFIAAPLSDAEALKKLEEVAKKDADGYYALNKKIYTRVDDKWVAIEPNK